MQRLYNYLLDHIKILAAILMIWLIPDFIFKGWVLTAHASVVIILIILMLIGEILQWEYPEEPCRFCAPVVRMPSPEEFDGFMIHNGFIWFSDARDGWMGTTIHYCPMCGRELEDDDV